MGPIKILILEHDPNDLELLVRTLKKSDLVYETSVCSTRESYIAALHDFCPDIILSDFSLPDFDGLSAYQLKMDFCPEIPFIVVSGTIGEEKAVELIKTGITDYALKEKIYVVPLKISRALAEAQERRLKLDMERELETSRRQLEKILEGSLDMICTMDFDGFFVNASAASLSILGYTPEELQRKKIWDLLYSEDLEKVQKIVQKGESHFESRLIHKSGALMPVVWSVHWNYQERMAYCVARDVSAIKKAEQELAEQDAQISNILESITDGFFSVDRNWCVQHWNRQSEALLGRKREEILGKNLWEEFSDAIPLKFYTEYRRVMNEGVIASFEEFFAPLNMWVSVDAYPSKEGMSVFFRDITEEKRQRSVSNLEREVLKIYTTQGSTIEETIRYLFEGIQQIHPALICSILKEEGGRLRFWNYSQLPAGYQEAIGAVEMTAGEGSCGTAAYLKKKVVVADISTDPLYDKYRNLAEEYGLKACTAYPLIDPYTNLLGTFTIYLQTSRPLSDAEEATVERAKYILENILENYFSEEKLKISEENHRILFQQSPSLLLVFDPVTLSFLNANEAALRHYGYSREEFLEMTVRDLQTPDGLVTMEKILHSSLHLPFFEATIDHRKKNGEVIRVHIQNTAITLDKKEVRMSLVTDITEKTRIERELELTQRRFRVLVQEGSDLIGILNSEGQYTYVSPAYSAIFGYKQEDLVKLNAFDLIHPDDIERITIQLEQIKKENRLKSDPYRYRRIDGEYVWIESIGTNLLHDPSIKGIVINSRDITESLNSLKAIERQNEQLRDIAWIQSHIVRAPVARIMGLVDLLNNYRENDKMRAEMLDHIVTSANELDLIIRDIVQKTEEVNGI